MSTTKTVKKDWSDYDKTIGFCHLAIYGVIFLDEYGCPIDNEYEADRMWDMYDKD